MHGVLLTRETHVRLGVHRVFTGFYFVSVTDSLIDHADTVWPKGPQSHSMGLSGVASSHPESDCQPRPKAKPPFGQGYIFWLHSNILPSFMVLFYLKTHPFVLPLTDDYLLEHGGNRGYWKSSPNLESFLPKNLSVSISLFLSSASEEERVPSSSELCVCSLPCLSRDRPLGISSHFCLFDFFPLTDFIASLCKHVLVLLFVALLTTEFYSIPVEPS